MKLKRIGFVLTLVLSLIMSTSFASASNFVYTDHEHDEYCAHDDEYISFEETCILSPADIIANNFPDGISIDYDILAQYSVADEVRNFLIENQNAGISTFNACSHPRVNWVNLGSSKTFAGAGDGFCFKIVDYRASQCTTCNQIVQVVETTTYTYHNFPSGGGACRNSGCGRMLMR